jgi:hypothetical protein
VRRWAELQATTNKILRERAVEKPADVSPSVAIPLIAAAINEDRAVLKDLWARRMAPVQNPQGSREHSVKLRAFFARFWRKLPRPPLRWCLQPRS